MIFLFLAKVVTKTISLRGQYVRLECTLWEFPGLQSLRIMRSLGKLQSVITVYDITRKDSLRIAAEWLDILRSEFSPDFFKALAGNKADLVSEREVTYEVICFSIGLRQA